MSRNLIDDNCMQTKNLPSCKTVQQQQLLLWCQGRCCALLRILNRWERSVCDWFLVLCCLHWLYIIISLHLKRKNPSKSFTPSICVSSVNMFAVCTSYEPVAIRSAFCSCWTRPGCKETWPDSDVSMTRMSRRRPLRLQRLELLHCRNFNNVGVNSSPVCFYWPSTAQCEIALYWGKLMARDRRATCNRDLDVNFSECVETMMR